MRFNLEEIPELTAEIAVTMGFAKAGTPVDEAAEMAVSGIENMLAEVGLPRHLKDFGVTDADISQCSELAMSDGSIVCNPRMIMEPEEVAAIYNLAV